MKLTFVMSHPLARRRAMAAVAEAPEGYVIEVKEPTRNLAQNALLHAELTEIARHTEWAGRKWDVETWKRLLTAAWMRTRGVQTTILPAIDGNGVEVLWAHTSSLSKAEFADLTSYVQAFAAEQSDAVA